MTADPADDAYIGAERVTSMTSEIGAQAHILLFALADPLGVSPDTRHTIIYDNSTAAKFAMSVANSKVNHLFAAVLGSLGQVFAHHRRVTWAHVHAHLGSGGKELADSLVEYYSLHTGEGQTARSVVAEWCVNYSEHMRTRWYPEIVQPLRPRQTQL